MSIAAFEGYGLCEPFGPNSRYAVEVLAQSQPVVRRLDLMLIPSSVVSPHSNVNLTYCDEQKSAACLWGVFILLRLKGCECLPLFCGIPAKFSHASVRMVEMAYFY